MDQNGEGEIDEAQLETTLRALASRRRLHLLLTLREAQASVPLSELAVRVAERESATDGADPPAEQVDHVTHSLRHVHLPKLQQAGVVDYDGDRGTVRLREDADDVRTVIDALFD